MLAIVGELGWNARFHAIWLHDSIYGFIVKFSKRFLGRVVSMRASGRDQGVCQYLQKARDNAYLTHLQWMKKRHWYRSPRGSNWRPLSKPISAEMFILGSELRGNGDRIFPIYHMLISQILRPLEAAQIKSITNDLWRKVWTLLQMCLILRATEHELFMPWLDCKTENEIFHCCLGREAFIKSHSEVGLRSSYQRALHQCREEGKST